MTREEMPLRWEDVTMDGRPLLEPLTASLSYVWRAELASHPLYAHCAERGIVPILTRHLLEAGDGPFAVDARLAIDGGWEVVRTADPVRLQLILRSEMQAPLGRTHLPPPDETGMRFAGRVTAEHVFTRPFADAAERRVTELGTYSQDARLVPWVEPKTLLALPMGARPAGPLEADPHQVFFGLSHTDSNQHVNSLVYSRLFSESVVRRLGRADVLPRRLDVRFRKPSFAGDRLTILLQPYERDGQLGACGAFVEPGASADTARVFLQLELG